MSQTSNTSNLVLRKGAWTAEEDTLLKKCIEKFGEGKWHLLPLRAGLNRCRKSCRLRWLNYLRPNIKRGNFDQDEVDLILRLHKLLGNRWSLIAGRISGRTANVVKNYWNTHLGSRAKQQKDQLKDGVPSKHAMVTVIKPQPHTISKTLNLPPNITTHDTGNLVTSSTNGIDKINEYLEELFDDWKKEINDEVGWSFGGFSEEGKGLNVVEQDAGQNNLIDFSIDEVVMWDLLP